MYVRNLADSLRRRWILVIVAVLMTVAVCFAASKTIPAAHETTASIVLVPPKDVDDPTANRFLALGNLTQAVDVLVRALNADTTRGIVAEMAPEGTYEVTVDDVTSAPVLLITATAVSGGESEALVDAVLQQVPVSLSTLQSGLSIARDAEITSIELTRDEVPTVSQKARMRAVAAAGILCLGGAFLLIGALDGILLVRSARKELRRRRDGAAREGMVEEDHAWLETELATITSGVSAAEPSAKNTKRRHSHGPSSRDRE